MNVKVDQRMMQYKLKGIQNRNKNKPKHIKINFCIHFIPVLTVL
jgi:hypothetical protein